MNKNEWKIIGEFKYNNSYYVAVVNDCCKHFYFKKNGEIYDYLDINEYLKLMKVFNKMKINRAYKNKNIIKPPLIKIKNKLVHQAILMSLIFSLTGCNTIKNPEDTMKKLNADGINVECMSEYNGIYSIEAASVDNLKNNTSCGVDFEGYVGTPFNKICTPKEFSQYVNIENVTWDDILLAIENNQNIDSTIKDILLYGANNLKESDFDMDLSLMYYNISNLNIEYKTEEELFYNAGYFDHITKTAYVSTNAYENPEFFKEVIIHEIFGHGMTRGYLEENGGLMCDIMTPYLIIDENGTINATGDCGFFAMEGIADVITSKAMNRCVNYDTSAYTTEVYYLATLCASVGMTLTDFANNGIEYLIQKMQEFGIENPYYYITVLDTQTRLLNAYEEVQINNTELFMDYFNELIATGNIEFIDSCKTEYLNYVELENMEGTDLIIRSKSDNSFVIIQPDEINFVIDSSIQQKK